MSNHFGTLCIKRLKAGPTFLGILWIPEIRAVTDKYGRSSHCRWSIKMALLKKFAIFTGKHLCWSLFLKKLLAWSSNRCLQVRHGVSPDLGDQWIRNIVNRTEKKLEKRCLLAVLIDYSGNYSELLQLFWICFNGNSATACNIRTKYDKIRTGKTPNRNTFQVVQVT